MGKSIYDNDLPPPEGLVLDPAWKDALRESMLNGNSIHDDLFDNEAVNLNLDDCIDIAGDTFGIQGTGPQMDLLGNPKVILGRWLNDISNRRDLSCHLFYSDGRAMLICVAKCEKIVFVDSHLHGNKGELGDKWGPIASSLRE